MCQHVSYKISKCSSLRIDTECDYLETIDILILILGVLLEACNQIPCLITSALIILLRDGKAGRRNGWSGENKIGAIGATSMENRSVIHFLFSGAALSAHICFYWHRRRSEILNLILIFGVVLEEYKQKPCFIPSALIILPRDGKNGRSKWWTGEKGRESERSCGEAVFYSLLTLFFSGTIISSRISLY